MARWYAHAPQKVEWCSRKSWWSRYAVLRQKQKWLIVRGINASSICLWSTVKLATVVLKVGGRLCHSHLSPINGWARISSWKLNSSRDWVNPNFLGFTHTKSAPKSKHGLRNKIDKTFPAGKAVDNELLVWILRLRHRLSSRFTL